MNLILLPTPSAYCALGLSYVMPTTVAGFGSQAKLRLYKYTHDANGQEVPGDEINDGQVIGGKVCVALEVAVDKHNRVAQDANTVTIRLKETSDLHDDLTNHADKVLPLYNSYPYMWQKYYTPDNQPLGWYYTGESPKSSNDSEAPVKYRLCFAWQTTQQTTSDIDPTPTPPPGGGYPGGGGGYPGGGYPGGGYPGGGGGYPGGGYPGGG